MKSFHRFSLLNNNNALQVCILLLIIGFILSCSKQTMLDEMTYQPPEEQVSTLPVSDQRIGDSEKGRTYLLSGDYVDSGIPLEIYKNFFPTGADELGRTGINEGIYHEYNAFTNAEGIDLVSPNCLQCHSGYVDGQFVLGLGNTNANFTMNTGALAGLLDAAVITSYGADSPEWRGYERFSAAIKATGGKIITEVVGSNSADKLAAVLASHRNRDDLSWEDMEMIELDDEVIPTDVPPWWLLKKKNAMFYTGVGRGDFARISMASSILTMKDSMSARNIDNNFVDVIAYLKTLEAPAYPRAIDQAKADMGKLIFEANCSGCHGTYGTDETYPNLLVDVSLVKTDPALLDANFGFGEFVDWYNESWFAQEPNAAKLVPGTGYVAPPLDGIWASAPYLHNGSVPTVEAVLNSEIRPAIWKRTDSFDSESLGFEYTTPESKIDIRTYDTSIPGYGNMGHYFGDRLSQEERMQLIEYLKTI